VLNELLAERAPESVRRWVRNRPTWLQVEHVDPEALSEAAEYLDSGEREAIALARML
jgi:predicted nucleic acid-binding protein